MSLGMMHLQVKGVPNLTPKKQTCNFTLKPARLNIHRPKIFAWFLSNSSQMCFLAVHLPSMSWPFANERYAGAFLRASIAHGDGMSVAPQPYQGPAKATGFVRRRLLNSEESHLPTWDKSKHPSSMRQIGHCESKWTSFALCIPPRYLQCHLCQFIRVKTHYLSSWLRQEGIIFQSSGRSPLPSLGLQHHATSGGNKSLLVSKARY